MFTYPSSPLDDPDALLASLGTFWSTIYGDSDTVLTLCKAALLQQRQAVVSGEDLLNACGRRTVPVFRRQRWYAWILSQSQENAGGLGLLHFQANNPVKFAPAGPVEFGVPSGPQTFAWALPTNLVTTAAAFNRLSQPSLTLIAGLDFTITAGAAFFRDDPFVNPFLPQTLILDADGNVTDRQITLWLYQSQFDHFDIYQQYGYVLGLENLASSSSARDLINSFYDALVIGSTAQSIQGAWEAATGVMLAQGPETVALITTDTTRTMVITDQRVYSFDPSVTVLVSVGDQLSLGQSLTDALEFFEFNHGQCPDPSDVPSLALGSGFLIPGLMGDLVFFNRDVPLIVTTDEQGKTKLSWELGGFPGDITAFFDALQARGVASGKTLAELLDRRPPANRETEPSAGALPPTINPLAFLCQNVLRDHAVLVKVRVSACHRGAGLTALRSLRPYLPPQTAMLLLTELDAVDGPITLEGPGTPTDPGYQESVSWFQGQSVTETVDPADYVVEDVQFRQVGGRCV